VRAAVLAVVKERRRRAHRLARVCVALAGGLHHRDQADVAGRSDGRPRTLLAARMGSGRGIAAGRGVLAGLSQVSTRRVAPSRHWLVDPARADRDAGRVRGAAAAEFSVAVPWAAWYCAYELTMERPRANADTTG